MDFGFDIRLYLKGETRSEYFGYLSYAIRALAKLTAGTVRSICKEGMAASSGAEYRTLS